MKITRVDLHEVVVPLKTAWHSPECGEERFDLVPKWVVEAHTDDGLIGLGETPRGAPLDLIRRAAEQLCSVDLLQTAWGHLGLQPGGADAAGHVLDKGFRSHEEWVLPTGYTAMEMAVFDLLGQRFGVPIHRLLGGGWRSHVTVGYCMGRCTPREAARRAVEAREMGCVTVKMKCTMDDPIVEIVKAIKSAAGADTRIVLDPNTRFYRLSEALDLAWRLESHERLLFEDPFDFNYLHWYREFRQRCRMPVALHLYHPQSLINAIRSEAADCVNLTPGGTAGMVRMIHLAEFAMCAGLPCWHGSGLELGIADTAYLHTAAACRGCTLPSDIAGLILREHHLLETPPRFHDGGFDVPDGPGLGVRLDREALKHYCRRVVTVIAQSPLIRGKGGPLMKAMSHRVIAQLEEEQLERHSRSSGR